MFKRIHSENKERKVSLELKKEFGKYFEKMNSLIHHFFIRYPRQIWALMILSILLSGVLAFTVMRNKAEGTLSIKVPTRASPSNVIETGSTLLEVLALQNQINTILQKDSLNASDSLILKEAFHKLDLIQSQIHSKQHPK